MSAASPAFAKDALPTLAQLAAWKRVTPSNDRPHALLHDGKCVEDATDNLPMAGLNFVHEPAECLRDMRFVPLRKRDGRLTIVMDRAIKKDEDAFRRIRQVEQEAVI